MKTVPFEIDLDGHAYHGIVVDNENAWHGGPPSLDMRLRQI
jgi:hypothetical protein